MELAFEKCTEKFWQQKSYAPVTREESQECKLPESMPDVGRVIAARGQTVLRGKEWRSDHIGLSGGVMVWVLYAPEDGSGPRRLESWVPFHIRMDHRHDGEDGVIRAECVLCGVDARSISSRKLMFRCQVGLMVQTLVPRAAELYHPRELPRPPLPLRAPPKPPLPSPVMSPRFPCGPTPSAVGAIRRPSTP